MKKFPIILFILTSIFYSNVAYSISPDVFVQSTVNRAAETLGTGLNKDDLTDELIDCSYCWHEKGTDVLP